MKSLSKGSNISSKLPVAAVFHGLIVSGIFLAVCALMLYIALSLNWVRPEVLRPIYLYGIYAAVFLGGLLAARNVKGHGWLTGIIFGFAFFVLSAIIGSVWSGPVFPIPVFLLRWVTMLIVGALAGMIGVNL